MHIFLWMRGMLLCCSLCTMHMWFVKCPKFVWTLKLDVNLICLFSGEAEKEYWAKLREGQDKRRQFAGNSRGRYLFFTQRGIWFGGIV